MDDQEWDLIQESGRLRYEVVKIDDLTHEEECYPLDVKSARAAMAAMRGEEGDFLRWFRASDGQTGYLNQDGNHSIEGVRWRW